MQVVIRHCTHSKNSETKQRPSTFDKQALFLALVDSVPSSIPIHIVLDSSCSHFVEKCSRVIVHKKALGSDAASYREVLRLVSTFPPSETVVLLEDDYKVSSDWIQYIDDGLQFADYVTLYDHPDKYSTAYDSLVSKVFHGKLHWRTTPSTTNSFACKVQTLLDDKDIHLESTMNGPVTIDHNKFMQLWNKNRKLVSSIPGKWSHEESGMTCAV